MIHEAVSSPPIEGIDEWLDLVEQTLHGLHHALNNRIGSLSAMVELLRLGDPPVDASGLENVSSELHRLEEGARMAGLLPRTRGTGEEPLILDDVIADVMAIHRYLHDTRDVSVTIAPNRFAEPVRVERWAIVRVLTLALCDAKRLAKRENVGVRVATESDEQRVRVQFRVASSNEIPAAARGRYAELLAEWFGGVVGRTAGTVEVSVPTLKARRAADRR